MSIWKIKGWMERRGTEKEEEGTRVSLREGTKGEKRIGKRDLVAAGAADV